MKKYHFNIRINIKDNNAGSKATEDCRTILVRNGFQDLELSFVKVWYLMPLNLIKLFVILSYYLIIIKSKSFIVVQYPLLGVNRFFKYYIKLLKRKGCKVCCIIHDLDCLRSAFDKKNIENELDALSAYDAVISHNASMSRWLLANGYTGHIEEIYLFDYLVKNARVKEHQINHKNGEIAFAGNLGRGNFLGKLAKQNNPFYLNLYGPGFGKNISENNGKIRWYGSFSPDQIINEVTGDFGLIWDGDSTEEITGLMGDYVRYNTPHKTSLYLASGLPVIVSKKAAIAEFVEANDIGVCIDTLSEISTNALNLTSGRYAQMKENALRIGARLRRGDYLRNAVIKTEQFLEKNN